MNNTIVKMQDIKKVYHQDSVSEHALRGLNLEVCAGEFTAICGPSGSGKTTALNIIGALDTPTKGIIEVEGKNLADLSKTELARMRLNRIGFIFQAYNLIPVLSAFENAEFVLMLRGIPEKERKEKVRAILGKVGMADMCDRRPDQLSGGQQQRVAIARAVVAEPALVLADEPTANVDSKTADSLLDLMERLNKERDVTFLFSTHDHRVMDRAARVVTLTDGIITEDIRR
ncbi:MAG: ABC transporter ATP-binding protein [Thermodesulfobacteriota bacterium]|nr:ABC transporter ATP-binding protein [Thermodesulfobacteriota bacterium]